MHNTPLHIIAAMEVPEAIDMLKACIAAGGDPTIKDVVCINLNYFIQHGRTPLHFAAGTENTELVKYLVTETSTDIDAVTEGGETALLKAILFGKANVVITLLDLKANVHIKAYVSISLTQFLILIQKLTLSFRMMNLP